jgi:hypothetical protein
MPDCLDYVNDTLIGNFGTTAEFKMHYGQQIDHNFSNDLSASRNVICKWSVKNNGHVFLVFIPHITL